MLNIFDIFIISVIYNIILEVNKMGGSEVSEENVGKTGLWTAATGAIIVLIDGLAVLATNNFYGWHYGDATVVSWVEIILSIIILLILPFYNRNHSATGWTIVILSLILLPFDGGFYTIGAWIALAGGVLIAYRK